MDLLEPMMEFIRSEAVRQGFSKKDVDQINLACEEIAVNVINYAYPGAEGKLEISLGENDDGMIITVSDSGIAYDPLKREDPDIALPVEERPIGGLGIFMVKRIMEEVRYARENDRNVLTMVKHKKVNSE